MKVLCYAFFTITVLLISGFAHASTAIPFSKPATYQTPVSISDLALQPENKVLIVTGVLANPCMQAPSASLIQDPKNPLILTLHLSSPMSEEICIARIERYITRLDLPTLARASQLNLDPHAIYLLVTPEADFQIKVSGADFYL